MIFYGCATRLFKAARQFAMANKAARITWVVMTRGEVYRARHPITEGTA